MNDNSIAFKMKLLPSTQPFSKYFRKCFCFLAGNIKQSVILGMQNNLTRVSTADTLAFRKVFCWRIYHPEAPKYTRANCHQAYVCTKIRACYFGCWSSCYRTVYVKDLNPEVWRRKSIFMQPSWTAMNISRMQFNFVVVTLRLIFFIFKLNLTLWKKSYRH